MKQNFLKQGLTVVSFAALLGSMSMMAGATELEPGVTVAANEDSATGYTVSFAYYNEDATNVQIMGGFQFFEANDERIYSNNMAEGDRYQNYLIAPEDWSKDADLRHVNDAGYIADMTKDEETGAWTFSLDLTGGMYLYQYNVSTDNGETYTSVIDPENIPYCNLIGAHQTRSQFFVPYDEEKQVPSDDWSWALPAENEEDRGTLLEVYYPAGNGQYEPTQIYLPAHYNMNREEPYKVLYLSHGWGGDEGDWFYQGNAGNIVDRLVAAGEAEEFIMVAMNNSVFDWDFDTIVENTVNHLVPFMEKNYNVSTEIEDRAFAGLSNGGTTAARILCDDSANFGWYGLFSSYGYTFPDLDDYVPNIYLASGWIDRSVREEMWSNNGQPVTTLTSISFAKELAEMGIECNSGAGVDIVQGAHDWFTWQQVIRNYVANSLWK